MIETSFAGISPANYRTVPLSNLKDHIYQVDQTCFIFYIYIYVCVKEEKQQKKEGPSYLPKLKRFLDDKDASLHRARIVCGPPMC